MLKEEAKAITRAVGISIVTSVVLHLSQKYILRTVDAVEYKLTEKRKTRKRRKRPVGFR